MKWETQEGREEQHLNSGVLSLAKSCHAGWAVTWTFGDIRLDGVCTDMFFQYLVFSGVWCALTKSKCYPCKHLNAQARFRRLR